MLLGSYWPCSTGCQLPPSSDWPSALGFYLHPISDWPRTPESHLPLISNWPNLPGFRRPLSSDWPGLAEPCCRLSVAMGTSSLLPAAFLVNFHPLGGGSHDRGQHGGGRWGLIGGACRAAPYPPASRAARGKPPRGRRLVAPPAARGYAERQEGARRRGPGRGGCWSWAGGGAGPARCPDDARGGGTGPCFRGGGGCLHPAAAGRGR